MYRQSGCDFGPKTGSSIMMVGLQGCRRCDGGSMLNVWEFDRLSLASRGLPEGFICRQAQPNGLRRRTTE